MIVFCIAIVLRILHVHAVLKMYLVSNHITWSAELFRLYCDQVFSLSLVHLCGIVHPYGLAVITWHLQRAKNNLKSYWILCTFIYLSFHDMTIFTVRQCCLVSGDHH